MLKQLLAIKPMQDLEAENRNTKLNRALAE
jgi:hypothetical protein